jgi:hypothetical protein
MPNPALNPYNTLGPSDPLLWEQSVTTRAVKAAQALPSVEDLAQSGDPLARFKGVALILSDARSLRREAGPDLARALRVLRTKYYAAFLLSALQSFMAWSIKLTDPENPFLYLEQAAEDTSKLLNDAEEALKALKAVEKGGSADGQLCLTPQFDSFLGPYREMVEDLNAKVAAKALENMRKAE